MAMGAVIFRSTGLHPDGDAVRPPRPRHRHADARARSARRGSAPIRHVSLKPGTPTPSHGQSAREASLTARTASIPDKLEITRARDVRKRAFLDLLKQEGVEIVFGNPGTTELPLMDAFAVENDIRYILGLQEAALMAMADGYAQASGKLTVLNLHVAPGLGNAMGMLYDAQMAGSPILVTAGQQDTEYLIEEPILFADLPTLARPFVKLAAQVDRLKDLPRLVHRAAKTALAPPTGPVFLSLPGDILKNDADIDLLKPTRVAPRMRGDIDAVDAAADLLAKAERPVIIAGDAVAQSRAHASSPRSPKLIGAPVYTEFVPNTASFPSSHPLYRGSMTRSQPGVREVLDQHDLLFSVGGDLFTWSLPSKIEPMPPGMPLIHLDTDPWQIGKNYPAEVGILGDPKATLPDITAAVRARMTAAAKAAAARGSIARPTPRSRPSARRSAPRRARSPARRRCSRSRCSKPSARCCRRTPW